jgi:hypothetical protein
MSGNDIGGVVYTADGMQREKCFGGMMVGQSGMAGEDRLTQQNQKTLWW